MELWLLTLFVALITVIIVLQLREEQSLIAGRKPCSLNEIYVAVSDRVSFEVFVETWTAVGNAYSIDPQLIRPGDTIKQLSKLDSWNLGEGEDELGAWLEQKNIAQPLPVPETVLELACWIEKAPARGV